MIGTAAPRAVSRNSPTAGAILEQTCLGSSHRAFMSRTRTAVVLASSVSGFGSGRWGPCCANTGATTTSAAKRANADFETILHLPCFAALLARGLWLDKLLQGCKMVSKSAFA